MIGLRRMTRAAVSGLALLALASCGEAPTSVARARGVSRDLQQQAASLVACTPLSADSVTQVIGPDGGTISVGPHSFTVPAGALDSAVSITAVMPSDVVNRVAFQPAGLTFHAPAMLTMSYANCGPLAHLLPTQIAYVDQLLNLLSYIPSISNARAESVTGAVAHFSDYAVAW